MKSPEILLAVLLACTPAADEDPTRDPPGTPEPVGAPGVVSAPAPTGAAAPTSAPAPVGTSAVARASILDRYDFDTPQARFQLPGRLDEISGLAMTSDGRLFAHDDERARIHEIDPATGRVGKRFDLGSGDVLDDFEGTTLVGDRFFLVSSRGFLYEFREGADDADVPYRVTDTGLGSRCEIEGLAYDTPNDALVMACKTTNASPRALTLYRMRVADSAITPIHVDRRGLAAVGLDDAFQPSAVWVTEEGTLIMLSAVTESILEIDGDGRILGGVALDSRRHPQPEGLAIGPDGTMYIADENNGGDPHITVYAPRGGDA